MIVLLEDKDITSCLHLRESQLLCTIHQPIYDIKVANTLCEAQIINNGNLATCPTGVSDCTDRWVRLHNRGTWLFSCCQECTARIFGPDEMTTHRLHGTGIITLGLGCMLKGDSFTIHARNNYHSQLKLNEENIYMSESNINHMVADFNYTFVPEDHKEILQRLKTNIDSVKKQQQKLAVQSQAHETHNYVLYFIIVVIILTFFAWGSFKLKRKYSFNLHPGQRPSETRAPVPVSTMQQPHSDIDSVMSETIAPAPRKHDKASPP